MCEQTGLSLARCGGIFLREITAVSKIIHSPLRIFTWRTLHKLVCKMLKTLTDTTQVTFSSGLEWKQTLERLFRLAFKCNCCVPLCSKGKHNKKSFWTTAAASQMWMHAKLQKHKRGIKFCCSWIWTKPAIIHGQQSLGHGRLPYSWTLTMIATGSIVSQCVNQQLRPICRGTR